MYKYMIITSDGEVEFFNDLYISRVYMAEAHFDRNLASWLYVLDKEKHYVCREEL